MKIVVLFLVALGLLLLGCVSKPVAQPTVATPAPVLPSVTAEVQTIAPEPTPTPIPLTSEKILKDSISRSFRVTNKKLVFDWVVDASMVKIKASVETVLGVGTKKVKGYFDNGQEQDTTTYFMTKEGEFACINITQKNFYVGYCVPEASARSSPEFSKTVVSLADLVLGGPEVDAAYHNLFIDNGFGDLNDEFEEKTVLGRPCHEITFVAKSLGKIPDDFTQFPSLNKALRKFTSHEATSCYDAKTGIALASKAESTVGSEGISVVATTKANLKSVEDYTPESFDFRFPFPIFEVPEGKSAHLAGTKSDAGFYAVFYPQEYEINTSSTWNFDLKTAGGAMSAVLYNGTQDEVVQAVKEHYLEDGAKDVKTSFNVLKTNNRGYNFTWHSVTANYEGNDGQKYFSTRMAGLGPNNRIVLLDLFTQDAYAETEYAELKKIAESFTIIDETIIG